MSEHTHFYPVAMARTSTKPSPCELLTPEQAREQLLQRGESVADFARRHKLKQRSVYGVLYGNNKGRRGESHKAAVALGIKAKPQS